jgi:YVTN family beta-propeller protein
VSSLSTTRSAQQRLSRPRRWRRGGTRAAALTFALAAGALIAAPAWAAGGYTITATIPVGHDASSVAVSPSGTRAYVTNVTSDTMSVINTATNHVTTTIPAGHRPGTVALSPNGQRAYVASVFGSNVTVIDTATGHIVATIPVGTSPDQTGWRSAPTAPVSMSPSPIQVIQALSR